MATVPVDEANPRCGQPWDGSPTDGGLVDEADAFEAEGSSPLVAMDEQGNGIVVWSVRCGDENRALARRYAASVGWGGVEVVMQDGQPTSVALRDGTALVALTGPAAVDAGPTSAGIYGACFTAGTWSSVPIGITSTGSWQEPYVAPPVAVLGETAGLVVWTHVDGHLAAANLLDGAWQPAQLLDGSDSDPTAAALPSGDFLVSGSQCPTGFCEILVTSWDPTAGWLPAAELGRAQVAKDPKLTCNRGQPHAIWSGTEGLMHAEQLSARRRCHGVRR